MKYINLNNMFVKNNMKEFACITVPCLKEKYKITEPEALFVKVLGLFFLIPVDVVKEAYRIQEDLDKIPNVQKPVPHSICLIQGEPIPQTLIKKIWFDCNNT